MQQNLVVVDKMRRTELLALVVIFVLCVHNGVGEISPTYSCIGKRFFHVLVKLCLRIDV